MHSVSPRARPRQIHDLIPPAVRDPADRRRSIAIIGQQPDDTTDLEPSSYGVQVCREVGVFRVISASRDHRSGIRDRRSAL